jgi:hypothetical protein
MTRRLSIEDCLRAESLKQAIRELEQQQQTISERFASYESSSVEEQLATRLAFTENRMLLGERSKELLRLVCV